MPPLHRGSLLMRTVPRKLTPTYICNSCATRTFSQARVLRDENASASPPPPAERPATRRQGAQMAGRMIQGLRTMARGGFGRSDSGDSTPRTTIRRVRENTPVGQTSMQRGPQQQRTPQRRQGGTPGGGAPSRSRKNEPAEEQESRAAAKPATDTARKLIEYLSTPAVKATDIRNARRPVEKPLMHRFNQGKVVRFANDAQRRRMLRLRDRTTKEKQMEGTYRTRKLLVPKGYREWLAARVVGGKYEALKQVEGTKDVRGKTMAQLQTSILRNGSYHPAARRAMLEFMGNMWPSQARAKAS